MALLEQMEDMVGQEGVLEQMEKLVGAGGASREVKGVIIIRSSRSR